MTIPRENRLVRLYVQLDENQDDGCHRFSTANVTPEMMLAEAKGILAPYQLDFQICDWSSIYTVSHTTTAICLQFADSARSDSVWRHDSVIRIGMFNKER